MVWKNWSSFENSSKIEYKLSGINKYTFTDIKTISVQRRHI